MRPRTSPLMLPVYAMIQPLFEPAHIFSPLFHAGAGPLRRICGRVPVLCRALVYGSGFHAVEYVSGRLLRRLVGQAPWDYSNVRWQLGLNRFDYRPTGQDAATGAALAAGGRQRKSS